MAGANKVERSRPWSGADELRLERLVEETEENLEKGMGEESARAAVLDMAGVDTVTALAEAMGVDRSNLGRCLSGNSKYRANRSELDQHLSLPPGGMERVLALLVHRLDG